jgi:predicted nucleic acid-binding protein
MDAPGVDDYLLDTSIWSMLLDDARPERQAVAAWEAGLPAHSRRLISVIALAELQFGRELMAGAGRETTRLDGILHSVRRLESLEVTTATAREYGKLKAAVVAKYLPNRLQDRSKKRWGNPESWSDEFTGEVLQIQENDLWQCAQAVERDVVFVTCDRGAERIRAASDANLRVIRLTLAAN